MNRVSFHRIYLYIFCAGIGAMSLLTSNLSAQITFFEPVPAEYSTQNRLYSGIIKDYITERPVENAELYVEGYGIIGYSDSAGVFNAEAPGNLTQLFFRKEGYIGSSVIFVNENDRAVFIIINLWPENVSDKELEIIQNKFKAAVPKTMPEESKYLKSTDIADVPATIRVLMPDNTVVVMDMDEYLKGVVPAEMPASWNMAALKAQAVAARCYASVNYKHASQGADVCTTTHCQAWTSNRNDKTSQAVSETSKTSVKFEGTVINALFFSHCDGHTRNNEDVWARSPVPYLRSVSCICGFTFHNAHGVGLCQYGSNAMASAGSSWEDILKHYYTGGSVDKPSTTTGTFKGVIYQGEDNSNINNRIIGATIRLNTGEQETSGEYGLYTFEVPPGTYTATASMNGYQDASVTRTVSGGTAIWGSIRLYAINEPLTLNAIENNTSIYPNPAKDLIFINVMENSRIQIFNLMGLLQKELMLEGSNSIDVSMLSPGGYIIRVISTEFTVDKKLIIGE